MGVDMKEYEKVLNFWFGELRSDQDFPEDKLKMWFRKSDEIDRYIQDHFEPDLQRAVAGELESWKETARGGLAWIILLDQFSRNIYRGTERAFAQDPLALQHALEMLTRGDDLMLRPIERPFIYLPLEHAEDLEMQRRSVRAFEQLMDDVPAGYEVAYDSFRDYAVRHQVIIQRFGRFPHRNAILGRESTPEERAFLKEPGSSF